MTLLYVSFIDWQSRGTLNIFSFLDTVKNGQREDVATLADTIADHCLHFWRLREGLKERANVRSVIQWKNFKKPAAQRVSVKRGVGVGVSFFFF